MLRARANPDRSHEHQDVAVEHLPLEDGPASPEEALIGSERLLRNGRVGGDGDHDRRMRRATVKVTEDPR